MKNVLHLIFIELLEKVPFYKEIILAPTESYSLTMVKMATQPIFGRN